VWWILYYKDGQKIQHSLKTRDKAVANFRKNEIENMLARGQSPFPEKNITVGQVYDEFIASRQAITQPRTVQYYQQTLSPFISAIGRESRISGVNDKILVDFLNSKTKVKECTTWHVIKAVNTFLLFAVSRGYLQKNPITVKKPRIPKRTPEVWTPEETKRIIAAAPHQTRDMIMLNLYLGLRPAELTRLRWDDIDLKTGVLTVQEAKDGEFRRIGLQPEAVDILERMGPKNGVVFPGMDTNRMRSIAEQIKKAAGVRHIKRFWYSIRHTFATTYYEQTGDLRGLQEILGHSKIEMTTVYVNPRRDRVKSVKYEI